MSDNYEAKAREIADNTWTEVRPRDRDALVREIVAFGRSCAAEAFEEAAKFVHGNTVGSDLSGLRIVRREKNDAQGVLLANELMSRAAALRKGEGK